MDITAAVRMRLESELGRVFGEMIAAQEEANALRAEVEVLRVQLAQSQDAVQRAEVG